VQWFVESKEPDENDSSKSVSVNLNLHAKISIRVGHNRIHDSIRQCMKVQNYSYTVEPLITDTN
jgi:hypothetical protein